MEKILIGKVFIFEKIRSRKKIEKEKIKNLIRINLILRKFKRSKIKLEKKAFPEILQYALICAVTRLLRLMYLSAPRKIMVNPNESIYDFNTRFLELYDQLDSIDQSAISVIDYENAMRPRSKIYERVAMADPSDLETAFNLAEKYENILNETQGNQEMWSSYGNTSNYNGRNKFFKSAHKSTAYHILYHLYLSKFLKSSNFEEQTVKCSYGADYNYTKKTKTLSRQHWKINNKLKFCMIFKNFRILEKSFKTDFLVGLSVNRTQVVRFMAIALIAIPRFPFTNSLTANIKGLEKNHTYLCCLEIRYVTKELSLDRLGVTMVLYRKAY
ncbi:hypothetical protein H8356DRAFT_1326197 [Neocallimastix lanati (nom. inval.)]|nr:hypothetical protein H8356DRAFT_1326197 [Neocallimastix sp. JGI-2020a]